MDHPALTARFPKPHCDEFISHLGCAGATEQELRFGGRHLAIGHVFGRVKQGADVQPIGGIGEPRHLSMGVKLYVELVVDRHAASA